MKSQYVIYTGLGMAVTAVVVAFLTGLLGIWMIAFTGSTWTNDEMFRPLMGYAAFFLTGLVVASGGWIYRAIRKMD